MADDGEYQLHFTVHHNWEWIFKEAVQGLRECLLCDNISFVIVDRYHQLPSQTVFKEKVEYSLFRVDVVSSAEIIGRVRFSSPIFERTDAKDLFYEKTNREYKKRSCSSPDSVCPFLPLTVLFPWDLLDQTSEDEQLRTLQRRFPTFPSYPAVLKAPMGSGGFGIYFVYHHEDIRVVVNNHARRAKDDLNFLQRIQALYESEPIPLSWSLQEFIHPVKTSLCPDPSPSTNSSLVRTQVRAYVIECNADLYLYSKYEVRCPSWEFDLEQILEEEQQAFGFRSGEGARRGEGRQRPWEEEVEEECCGTGFARPYNEGRDKKRTYRLMVEEIPELLPAVPAITENLLSCFRHIKSLLLSEKYRSLPEDSSGSDDRDKAALAIIGIDLLVSRAEEGEGDFSVKIVELNNNPAMPGRGKRMTERYYRHLLELQQHLIRFSVAKSLSKSLEALTPSSALAKLLEASSERFLLI